MGLPQAFRFICMSQQIAPNVLKAHDDAELRGDGGYLDPETGLFVMTAMQLSLRGHCCGQGCRHCPYSPKEQLRAGRPVIREDSKTELSVINSDS